MKKSNVYALIVALVSSLYAGDVFEGVVVETLDAGGYTYLQIEDAKKKYWVAVEGVKIDKGVEVRFTEEMRVKEFKSQSLGRVFDEIIFASNLQYRTKVAETGNLALIREHVEISSYQQKGTISVKEALQKREELKGKTIAIRGRVVKASANILERNFIHLQDGTGENKEVGRIVFTSKELPKVGDVLTATGTVSVDKNFGSGYVYPIIVENASFTK